MNKGDIMKLKEVDLNALDKDTLADLVRTLAAGKNPNDITIDVTAPAKKHIANNLHTILCAKNHDEGGCTYYKDNWDDEDHKYWYSFVEELVSVISIPELYRVVSDVQSLFVEIEKQDTPYQKVLLRILNIYVTRGLSLHNQPH
jgi:hypothetical protein